MAAADATGGGEVTEAATVALERAAGYAERGWWRLARRTGSAALAQFPEDPPLLAFAARCDAELGDVAFGDAERRVRALAAQYPERVRLRVAAAALAYRGGHTQEALAELLALTEQHPTDRHVRQAYAGLLGCDRDRWPEAWREYRTVLDRVGSLSSSSSRAAAFALAKNIEPDSRAIALAGASPVERAAIRTRTLHRRWVTLMVVAGFAGVLCQSARLTATATVLLVLTTAWATWVIGTLVYVRMCRRCLVGWIVIIAALWLLYALATVDHHAVAWIAYLGGGVVLGQLVARRQKRLERRTPTTEGSSAARTAG